MTSATEKILSEALALTTDERRTLAAELLASVGDAMDDDWEQAWADEVDRRAAAANLRGTPPAEWSEVRARILSKLASR